MEEPTRAARCTKKRQSRDSDLDAYQCEDSQTA